MKSFHLTTEEQEIQMVGARSLKINDAHSSLKNGASCLKKGSESRLNVGLGSLDDIGSPNTVGLPIPDTGN